MFWCRAKPGILSVCPSQQRESDSEGDRTDRPDQDLPEGPPTFLTEGAFILVPLVVTLILSGGFLLSNRRY